MTKQRKASVTAAIGAGLLFATSGLHLSAYFSVVAQAPTDLRSLMAALWVCVGVSLVIAGLLAVAATPVVAGELGRVYQPRPQ